MVYDCSGNKEKALDYYKKALDIRLPLFGNVHPLISTTYSNIASVYKELKQYDKALEFYIMADQSLPENSRKRETLKQMIQEINRLIGK